MEKRSDFEEGCMGKLQTGKTGSEKKPQSKGGSKKSSLTVFIIIIVIILIFVTASIVIFMLNIGNLRDSVLAVISPETAVEEEISEQQRLEAQIRDEIIRLSAVEDELEKRESELNVRENELNLKEEEINRIMQENIVVQERLSPQLESLMSITEIYSNMESEQAALILSAMESDEQIILIIKNMDNEKSGEILGLMEAERAAGLIERMMLQE